MTNHTKTLEALVAAGDTDGWWCPNCGETDCTFHGNCEKCGIHIEELDTEGSIPALKALLDELKEKDRVMGVMAEELRLCRKGFWEEWHANMSEKDFDSEPSIEDIDQALAQFEKIKGDER